MNENRKFNHKFNTRLKSIRRWHIIVDKLFEFEGVINSYDGASPDEVKTLKLMHKKLYECCVMAKEHLRSLNQ